MPHAGSRHRVVLVAHSHHLGGMERHVVTLASALAEQGHAVAYAGPAQGWMGERMAADGHHCLDLSMRGMYDLRSAWRLAGFSREWGATVLHGHAMRGARYADWASRRSGVPVVATAHSTNAWKWLLARMHVIAVSEAVRRMLVDHGLPAGRISLVYNGVPDPTPRPAGEVTSAAQAISAGERRPLRIGLIGRLEPIKGHDLALKALAMLRRRLPAQLLFAGVGQAAWTQALAAQAQALGVAPWVDFLGQVDDVSLLLAGLDLIVAPSRREALSLALVEAAAAGLACVAARVGGIPEVVRDGVSGLLVPPDDAESLGDAVEQLALDAPRRAQLGQQARLRYEERFTLEAMCKAIVEVYDSALPERKGRAR